MENIKLNDYTKGIERNGKNPERRYLKADIKFKEIEANGAKTKDENTLSGYAAVFNKDSENFGGWVERIAPGAFNAVMEDECFALFNHSMNHVLGRNGVNVTLTQDDIGLGFDIALPDTTLARDLKTLVRADIINKCSFAFIVEEETWTSGDKEKNTPAVRTINRIGELFDVSVVTVPAYPDTSVAARSMENFKKEVEKKVDKETGMDEIKKALQAQRKIKIGFLNNRKNYKQFIF